MIRKVLPAAGAWLALLPPPATALDLTVGSGAAQNCPESGRGIAFNASAITYLEPAPVVTFDDYGDGRYAPSAGNNIGIGLGFSELAGAVGGGACVGVVYRAELVAEATKDLLDVLVANHFGQPFEPGRRYGLSMTEMSFQAVGVRGRKTFHVDLSGNWSLKLGVGVSVLNGLQGEQQSASGEVTATSDTYAVGTAAWLRAQSNLSASDFNPFVAPGTPWAVGFSTDFEIIARSTDGWSADFAVMDAVGRLYWHDVPHTLETLNNAAISYNANLDRNALVNGFDWRGDFTQNMTAKYHLALTTARFGEWSAVAGDDSISGIHFPSVGAQYGQGEHSANVSFDIRTRAVGIGARLGSMMAAVTTNDIHLSNATVLGVSLQAVHSW